MRRPTYSAALMNDTKWREVLSLLSRLDISFEVAYVWDERFRTPFTVMEMSLRDSHVADPGLGGGPTEYRDIFSIRIPRTLPLRNPRTGEVQQTIENSDRFLAEAAKLGRLPLREEGGFIYLDGYSHRIEMR